MSLVRITGWIALALLAISFCTPVKSPKLNSLFSGFRTQLKLHHWLGIIAIVFILAHMMALIVDYSSSLHLMIDLLDTSILTGWIATLSTGLVAAVAFRFRNMPYRRWRFIHLSLILGFLAALLHSLYILEPRSFMEWVPILLFSLIGGIGFVWTVLIPRSAHFGVPYIIKSQTMVRPNLITQVLIPDKPGKSLRLSAGQFVYVRYCDPQFSKMWHPFTVVRFSENGEFELLIKSRGQDTNILPYMKTPSSVRINGPFGERFWRSDKPQVWLAYGVGVAIFLAAARNMPDDLSSNVYFVYCEKSRDHIIFQHEFDTLSVRKNNFSWIQYYGEGSDVVEQLKKDIFAWAKSYQLFRVCGHPGFQSSVKRILIHAGVASHKIILEGVY